MKCSWRRKRLLVGCLFAVACDGLTSELERDADEVPPSEIIDLVRLRTASVPADGRSADTLIAMIPLEASSPLVTFNTTAGTFIESGSREVKVRAEPDSLRVDGLVVSLGRRLARTVLRSDTLTATAIVRATVGGEFYDTVSVSFVRP